MKSITGVITTLNEEHNIAAAIASLKEICDEIIVVDSKSSDNTRTIAEKAGARVIVQEYLGDGPQKNVGLNYARNDWVFSLDADERLTPELVEVIRSLDLTNSPFQSYAVRRRNMIGNRWIKVCGWYPDFFIRLFDRRRTRFSDSRAHARVPDTQSSRLKADLIHYSYRHVGELFSKGDRFSTRGAKILYANGRISYWWSPILHAKLAFIKKFIFKLGFLGGLDGLTVSLSAGVNSYLKWAKLRELNSRSEESKNLDQTDEIIDQKNMWDL